ncbi:Homeobox protein HD-8 [Nosema bombycis CQ1]|uniref:Homeobox protein HD-8 n=1 Tax=Nosema bombycis (strain CQ1 / CVCC 102059) TaxID=578461 RepID=R0MJ91_NOSB1|nr:Homeobox protein HD-8 [Nosema bombycis CQ1]|eukprot:EOB14280.1 Homeobox protein HD-8 [Nosema bombycis CQ1]
MQAALGLILMKKGDRPEGKRTTYHNLVLRRIYKLIKYPSQQTQKDLSIILGLEIKAIKLWFQNERQSEDKMTLREGFEGFEISPTIIYKICREVKRDCGHKINPL